jgi:hypothetical protein
VTNKELFEKLIRENKGEVLACIDNKYYSITEAGQRGCDTILHVGQLWKRTLGKEYTVDQLKVGDIITLPNTVNSPFMHMKVTEIGPEMITCVRPYVTIDDGKAIISSETFPIHRETTHKYVLVGSDNWNEKRED